VKPQRDQHKRASYRENWWIFAEPRARFRASVAGLSRYIATSEVGKHRFFVFSTPPSFPMAHSSPPTSTTPSTSASSSRHSRHRRSGCRWTHGSMVTIHATKPPAASILSFPVATEELAARIRTLAEEIDAHRKRAQSQHGAGSPPKSTTSSPKLRAGTRPYLGGKHLHDVALVSTLRHLHDELDAAVAAATDGPPI